MKHPLRSTGKTTVFMDVRSVLARIGTSGQIVDLFNEYGIATRPNTIAKWRAQRYLPYWAIAVLQKAHEDGKINAEPPGFDDIECVVAERGSKTSVVQFPAFNPEAPSAAASDAA